MNSAPSPSTPFVVAGATASGKSTFALNLAQKLDAEIVNLDPFQALQGLPLLTAQPSLEEQNKVPHHLYGCFPLTAEINAVSFVDQVKTTLTEINSRKKQAILVTGSGLYLRAFSHGIDTKLPATPATLAAQIRARSLAENLAELECLDPVEAQRIDRANPCRVERALALCKLLGQPVSEYRSATPHWKSPPKTPVKGYFLDWERSQLWQRIEQRAKLMFSQGVTAEVAQIAEHSLGESAQKIIGLADIIAHLRGELSQVEVQEKLIIRTRQYAKRQQTWFRKEAWLEPVAGAAIESLFLEGLP